MRVLASGGTLIIRVTPSRGNPSLAGLGELQFMHGPTLKGPLHDVLPFPQTRRLQGGERFQG